VFPKVYRPRSHRKHLNNYLDADRTRFYKNVKGCMFTTRSKPAAGNAASTVIEAEVESTAESTTSAEQDTWMIIDSVETEGVADQATEPEQSLEQANSETTTIRDSLSPGYRSLQNKVPQRMRSLTAHRQLQKIQPLNRSQSRLILRSRERSQLEIILIHILLRWTKERFIGGCRGVITRIISMDTCSKFLLMRTGNASTK